MTDVHFRPLAGVKKPPLTPEQEARIREIASAVRAEERDREYAERVRQNFANRMAEWQSFNDSQRELYAYLYEPQIRAEQLLADRQTSQGQH